MLASVAGHASISGEGGSDANGSRHTRLRRSGAGSHPSNEPAAVKVHAMIEKTIKRDPEGRFERHGKTLAKTAKKSGLIKSEPETKSQHGGFRPGSGRKPGSKNRVTLALKEAVLSALEKVGGEEYLARLAVENSSAFAALLGRILPHTLAAASDSTGGKTGGITFQRIIVWPDGHKEIEGVTPKQITNQAKTEESEGE